MFFFLKHGVLVQLKKIVKLLVTNFLVNFCPSLGVSSCHRQYTAVCKCSRSKSRS